MEIRCSVEFDSKTMQGAIFVTPCARELMHVAYEKITLDSEMHRVTDSVQGHRYSR